MGQLKDNCGTKKICFISFTDGKIRHASDYDDFYVASRSETERQIVVAEEFIKMVEKYCLQRFDAE